LTPSQFRELEREEREFMLAVYVTKNQIDGALAYKQYKRRK